MTRIVLASASPRRRELLLPFFPDMESIPPSVEEDLPRSFASPQDAATAAERLALSKARSLFEGGKVIGRPGERGEERIEGKVEEKIVLGADTIVLVDGRVLGKPRDREEAREMLLLLSGKEHWVITGVAVTDSTEERVASAITKVEFLPLSEEDVNTYLDTKEHRDKAGAYGIQGKGSGLIKGIEGSWSNVVGLPLDTTAKLFESFSVPLSAHSGPAVVVVGMPGSGKEEFVRVARERLYAVIRMGDVVRDEVARADIASGDVSVGDFASTQRELHGVHIWASRTLERMEKMDAYKVVVDGTRSHHEIDAFKEALGQRFHLVAVTAPQDMRYDRLVSRARSDAPESFQAF
ncbi:MAG: septum formation protein Maf, partial [Thermoplasmata archaeon]|nr:septum formation protein Maf [Thermoplasmata archaeon]